MTRMLPALTIALATLVAAPAAAQAPLVTLHDTEGARVDALTRQAFRAAFGAEASAHVTRDGRDFTFHPIATFDLGGGRIALLSTGALEGAGHADDGLNAVHYLERQRGGALRVTGQWFGLGAGGSHGHAANRWGVVRALSRWPVVYTEGGGTWQGCTVSVATLTELRPDRPLDIAEVPVHFSNEGMSGERNPQIVDGRLSRVVAGSSFTVQYQGSRRFTERYLRSGDVYRLQAGPTRMPGC